MSPLQPCVPLWSGQKQAEEQHTERNYTKLEQEKRSLTTCTCTKAYDDTPVTRVISRFHILPMLMRAPTCPVSTGLLILLYALSYFSFSVFLCNKECLQNAGNFLTLHSQGL